MSKYINLAYAYAKSALSRNIYIILNLADDKGTCKLKVASYYFPQHLGAMPTKGRKDMFYLMMHSTYGKGPFR